MQEWFICIVFQKLLFMCYYWEHLLTCDDKRKGLFWLYSYILVKQWKSNCLDRLSMCVGLGDHCDILSTLFLPKREFNIQNTFPYLIIDSSSSKKIGFFLSQRRLWSVLQYIHVFSSYIIMIQYSWNPRKISTRKSCLFQYQHLWLQLIST